MNNRKIYWLGAPQEAHDQKLKVKGEFAKMTEDEFFAKLDELAEGKIKGHEHGGSDPTHQEVIQAYSKRRELVRHMPQLLALWPLVEGECPNLLVVSITEIEGQPPTVPDLLWKTAHAALCVYKAGTSKFQGTDERPFFKWMRRFPVVYRTATPR